MFDEKTIQIFSSRDKIRDQIVEYAKKYLELDGLDFSKTSYLSYLINILSALTANLLYFSTSTYREMFLTKAVQKESVLNLAAMIGYTPPYAVPATTSVLVKINLNFSALKQNSGFITFEIPKGHKYYAGDIVFSQDSKLIVSATNNEGSVTYLVREYPLTGGSRTLKNVIDEESDGSKYLCFVTNVTQIEERVFEYNIPTLGSYEFYNINVEFSGQVASINVQTKDSVTENTVLTTWDLKDSVFLISYEEKGYVFRRTVDGGQVMFGNGIVGVQPSQNHICLVTIGVTKGENGNVIAGSITKMDRLYLSDWDSTSGKTINRPLKIKVVNTEPVSGGSNSPTIDEIKTTAIDNLFTMKRLVTKDDFNSIKSVIPELPVNNVLTVLKRSDIKQNEISLFTDILFNDQIVPTRNPSVIISEADNPEFNLYITDKIEIIGIEYYPLFNISIDTINSECLYYYMLSSLEDSVVLTRTYTTETQVLPTVSKFYTITADEFGDRLPAIDQTLEIELNFDIINPQFDIGTLQCYMLSDYDGNLKQMTKQTINIGEEDEREIFTLSLPLESIDYSNRMYYFKMYTLVENPHFNPGLPTGPTNPTHIPSYLNESQIKMLVKEELDEFMYSNIKIMGTSPNRTVQIYDVPVVKKDYYDNIDGDTFIKQIYNKILTFDITSFRMSTDFINLKYCDTTGELNNMSLNKTTRDPINGYNPYNMPAGPSDGDRYAVTSPENPWDRDPPFITEYNSDSSAWFFETLATNDIIYVNSISKKLIFNGTELLNPVKTIPLILELVVWREPSHSATNSGLIESIKDSLIDNFYPKFGFDKNIYLSEIIRVVQSVSGVDHCKMKSPKHDIFFNFDLQKDLTEDELLVYTPQLVFFDTTNISIEIK